MNSQNIFTTISVLCFISILLILSSLGFSSNIKASFKIPNEEYTQPISNLSISMNDHLEILSEESRKHTKQNILIEYISKLNSSPVLARKIVISAFEIANLYQMEPTLILGLIEKESYFLNINSTSSNAKGLMQVIAYWHKDKIKKLGISDLTDPYENILLGTEVFQTYLKLSKGDVADALYKYNGATNPYYSTKVLKNKSKLDNLLKNSG